MCFKLEDTPATCALCDGARAANRSLAKGCEVNQNMQAKQSPIFLTTPRRTHSSFRTINAEQMVNTCNAVSYTHLDVYKRQVCVCVCVSIWRFFFYGKR